MNDNELEQEIQDKGLTAPRVTSDDIEANIVHEYYFTANQGAQKAHNESQSPKMLFIHKSLPLLTFCVLVLKNGFTVTGEPACASPENFDPEIGRKIARQNAINKVWPLMGYQLKQQLFDER